MSTSPRTEPGAPGGKTAPLPKEPVYTRNYLLLFAAEVSVYISLYVALPILPLYILHLGGSESQVGFLLAAASVIGLVTTPLYGRAVDRFGRKIVLLLGLIVNGFFTLTLAAIQSIVALTAPLVGRSAAFGASGTASRTLVFDIAPTPRRGEAISTFLVGHNVAIAFGPALGLLLLHRFDFWAPFLAATALCLLSLLLAVWVPESRRPAPPPATAHGRAGGWYVPEALFPSSVQLLISMSYGAIISFLAVVGEERGIGHYQFFFTSYAAVVILVRVFGGRISDRFGRAAVLLPALLSQVVSLAIVSVASSLPELMIAAAALGLGWGAAYPALTALTADRVEPARRGTAMGFFAASFSLGLSLGTAATGTIAERSSFTTAYLFAAFLVVCAFFLCLAGLRATGELRIKRAGSRA